jgi:membrane fusion protein (multidrug efflux system)
MSSLRPLSPIAAAALMLSLLSGCGDNIKSAQAQGAGMPPPEVAVVTVAPERVAIASELPGRLEATRVAQVRARVPGIVTKRTFREGSDVKAGEVLFRIDDAPFQAAYNSTLATLTRAEANLAQANLKVQRYRPLVETNAISKQEYDEAVTAQKQATADVAAAKAARETARLNLGYATVNSPISGRIGRALVTEGALVGQGEATPLALVQQIDPIYVNVTQSATEALELQRALAEGKLQSAGKGQAKVTVLMADGREYARPGKLLFSDLTVDPSSGAITLRAEVPNPDRFLLPGMYVRARIEQAVKDQAITVPQQAVQRDQDGASVMVVGADGKVSVQPVKADTSHGNDWIISEGLKAGDRVIVEGFQKVKPGAVVKPVQWKQGPANPGQSQGAAPQASAAPAKPGTAQAAEKPKAN